MCLECYNTDCIYDITVVFGFGGCCILLLYNDIDVSLICQKCNDWFVSSNLNMGEQYLIGIIDI